MSEAITPDQKATSGAWGYVLGFLLVNLIIKLPLLKINQGEYTDGVLQLTVFSNDAGLYQPLYGGLSWLVSHLGFSLEMSGRIVSMIASVLTVIPVYFLARWLYSDCAARFAALFYTVSPLVTRWSVRVMTDSLFLLLVTVAVAWFIKGLAGTTRSGEYGETLDRRSSDLDIGLASVFAALSAMTRLQGILTIPFLALGLFLYVRRFKSIPWVTVLLSLFWLALPAWYFTHNFVHGTQFQQRTTGQWIYTLLAYLNVFESFVLIAPYYVAFPVAAFFAAGIAHLDLRRPRVYWFLWVYGSLALMLLVLQSVFQSFQYRYMLPLMPGILAVAGAGCNWFENWITDRGRRWLFSVIFGAGMIYMTIFTCAVLVFQRQTFGDQRAAAEFIIQNVPRTTPLFSNELYGSFKDQQSLKLRYWTNRPFQSVYDYIPEVPGTPPPKLMPAGSVIVLGNVYGGDSYLDYIVSQLTYFYRVRTIANFNSTVSPLHDDVMAQPQYNQNPMGWVLRYTPQFFTTQVLYVDAPRTQEEIRALVGRQVAPPGIRPVRGPDGKLTIIADDLTTTAQGKDKR